MKKKIYSYLGFAKKSGNLLTGYNTCMYGLSKRQIRLLILTEDLSDNTLKRFTQLAQKYKVPLTVMGTKEELSSCTGEIDKGIYGITDRNFADVIQRELEQEE